MAFTIRHKFIQHAVLASFIVLIPLGSYAQSVAPLAAPVPLLTVGQPVDWWFVYKFNKESFPGSGAADQKERQCPFGGSPVKPAFQAGSQFVYASSTHPTLQKGSGFIGDNDKGAIDPLGATFDEIYNKGYNYVVWNDQPLTPVPSPPNRFQTGSTCVGGCAAPWGHSKGILVWDDQGNGLVLQVTTPGWPVSGSANPKDIIGDSLGCSKGANNLILAQDFFALKLNPEGVASVLRALANASAVTDISNPIFAHNGGPKDIQSLVEQLGKQSSSTSILFDKNLAPNVGLISDPSALPVPPWQLVSSELGGIDLRTATFWSDPKIYTTTASTPIKCWNSSLGKPGAVEIATTGTWDGKSINLTGGDSTHYFANGNHAKIGVSLGVSQPFTIFGDMNQQGSISSNCASSQNGRGGLFFVIDNKELWQSVSDLLKGETAPAYDANGNLPVTATPAASTTN